MPWSSKLDLHDGVDGGIPKPREVLEGHEQLSVAKKQPDAVL
jgi:hypothetical protein